MRLKNWMWLRRYCGGAPPPRARGDATATGSNQRTKDDNDDNFEDELTCNKL